MVSDVNDRTLREKLADILGGKPQEVEMPSEAPSPAEDLTSESAAEAHPEIVFDDDVPVAVEAPAVSIERRTIDVVALYDLLLAELGKEPGCPKTGVTITVYGHRPWNAMVVFAPGSVTSAVAGRLRHSLIDIVSRLRPQFDIPVG